MMCTSTRTDPYLCACSRQFSVSFLVFEISELEILKDGRSIQTWTSESTKLEVGTDITQVISENVQFTCELWLARGIEKSLFSSCCCCCRWWTWVTLRNALKLLSMKNEQDEWHHCSRRNTSGWGRTFLHYGWSDWRRRSCVRLLPLARSIHFNSSRGVVVIVEVDWEQKARHWQLIFHQVITNLGPTYWNPVMGDQGNQRRDLLLVPQHAPLLYRAIHCTGSALSFIRYGMWHFPRATATFNSTFFYHGFEGQSWWSSYCPSSRVFDYVNVVRNEWLFHTFEKPCPLFNAKGHDQSCKC